MEILNRTVTELFIATDQRDWPRVENCFATRVELDYSSMTGNPAKELTPSEIIAGWKLVLPGFENTHHQLGNFLTSGDQDHAHVFCYGTANHYLTDEKGNLWTVVGSYDFDLEKQNGAWRITKMKFNFKYQSGNTSLPEKAMALLKN